MSPREAGSQCQRADVPGRAQVPVSGAVEHGQESGGPGAVDHAAPVGPRDGAEAAAAPSADVRTWVALVVTGLAAGFLSGVFGVGGGLVIVPALMAVVGMDQRRAAATSLAAIVLTAAVGAVSYASQGQVSLVAAVGVSLGALLGAQVGTWLLRRLPDAALPWTLVGFVVIVIVSSQLREPVREAALEVTWWRLVALVGVGLVAGVLSGLVGVGGGSVIVPGLELAVGVGDLLARGTSLLVMIPTAVAGTWSNWRHGLVDLRRGAAVGCGAVVAAPCGTWVAGAISPRTGSVLFSVFLACVVVHTVHRARRARARRCGEASCAAVRRGSEQAGEQVVSKPVR